MKTRCPCCGAENSLDALLAHEDARLAVWSVAQLSGEIGTLAVKYVALFRPAKGSLSMGRLAKLLNELLPDMQKQSICRDGNHYFVPQQAWIFGFQTVLAARTTGHLKLPLKSHGYLYEVMASWQGQGLQTTPSLEQKTPEPTPQHSQTLSAAMQLQGLKR